MILGSYVMLWSYMILGFYVDAVVLQETRYRILSIGDTAAETAVQQRQQYSSFSHHTRRAVVGGYMVFAH